MLVHRLGQRDALGGADQHGRGAAVAGRDIKPVISHRQIGGQDEAQGAVRGFQRRGQRLTGLGAFEREFGAHRLPGADVQQHRRFLAKTDDERGRHDTRLHGALMRRKGRLDGGVIGGVDAECGQHADDGLVAVLDIGAELVDEGSGHAMRMGQADKRADEALGGFAGHDGAPWEQTEWSGR